MSLSLAEERDRVRRQIEELEQNLGAAPVDLDLLSSDASSDDGSDDEIQLVEQSHQVSSGLLAERDQIQQEIEELQTALQSQNDICLSVNDGNDSGESEGELDVPETEEGCLQVNLVYQQVLIDSLSQLEHLLNQNRRAQKELLFQMNGPTRDIRDPSKVYLGRFHKPYFKDKLTGLHISCLTACRNLSQKFDTKSLGFLTNLPKWEGWQKTLLINAVSKDSLKRQIQPKLSKVDYLSQKMYKAREEEKEALSEQIGQLEKDIQQLRTQKEEDLVGGRYDEHDWQKISNIDFEGTREADDLRQFWQNFLHPSVNKSTWTPQELERLDELVKEHKERDWEGIAEELGTGRTVFMCFQTYQRFLSKNLKKSLWSAEEDEVLRELVDKMRIGNFIPYTQMSYFIEGRDPSQLMYRWSQVLDPALRKGPWSKEEDKALLRSVARLGERNWSKIRLEVPGRSDGACRDRYCDCLKEGIKRGPFDAQEIALLVTLVEKHGVGRWSRIAAEIPNRYDAQCLREWRKFVKKNATLTLLEKDIPVQKMKGRRLPAGKRDIKKEEEEVLLTESSEDEDEDKDEVVYMDSDDEKMKQVVEAEPPENIKCPTKEKRAALDTFSYQVVERPCFGPVQHREKRVRSTLVDARGNLLETLFGMEPRVLRCGSQHSPLALLQVSCSELFDFLTRCADCTPNSFSQNKPGKRRRFARNNPSMDYRLMAAVTPWIGKLLVPDPNAGGKTGAYALRQRMQPLSLGSTPIFRLFLQVLRVDLLSCKVIIEKKQREARVPPPRLRPHIPNPTTVQGMLHEKLKRAQGRKELQKCLPQLVQFPAQQPLLQQAQAPPSPQVSLMRIPQMAPQSPSMPPNVHPCSRPGAPSTFHPVMQPVVPPQMAALRFTPPRGLVPRQQSPGAVRLLPRIAPAPSPAKALLPIQAPPWLSSSSAATPAGPASLLSQGSAPLRGAKRGRTPNLSPIVHPSVFTAIPPATVSTAVPPPSVPTAVRPAVVSTCPAPLSPHPQGLPPSPRPQWRQVAPGPAGLLARPFPVSVPCHSSAVAPAPLRREALQFDPALMFCEPADEVQLWMRGAGGLKAPGLSVALPYLPPFVASLDSLHALLASKEYLSKNAFLLREATAEENVAAVRKLVAKHCAGNPAYQMLKARFLSCFTVPALLATIQPIKELMVLNPARKETEVSFTSVVSFISSHFVLS
uniref:snRNA-activating protein complex subunit 4 n=1 Tax=Gadus morhua TaxID=8049 RepID=A0A8C4Z1S9_GADMO